MGAFGLKSGFVHPLGDAPSDGFRGTAGFVGTEKIQNGPAIFGGPVQLAEQNAELIRVVSDGEGGGFHVEIQIPLETAGGVEQDDRAHQQGEISGAGGIVRNQQIRSLHQQGHFRKIRFVNHRAGHGGVLIVGSGDDFPILPGGLAQGLRRPGEIEIRPESAAPGGIPEGGGVEGDFSRFRQTAGSPGLGLIQGMEQAVVSGKAYLQHFAGIAKGRAVHAFAEIGTGHRQIHVLSVGKAAVGVHIPEDFFETPVAMPGLDVFLVGKFPLKEGAVEIIHDDPGGGRFPQPGRGTGFRPANPVRRGRVLFQLKHHVRIRPQGVQRLGDGQGTIGT